MSRPPTPEASGGAPDGRAAAGPATPLRDECLGWLEQLARERAYSPRTIASYRHALTDLCELAADTPFTELTAHQIRGWAAQMARRGLKPRSIAHRLSVWRGFLDYCAGAGAAHAAAADPDGKPARANAARGVRGPRAPRRLPKALSPDMAARLADYQPGAGFEMVRDKAMLELLYSSGLRLAELCSLDAEYCDGGEANGGRPRSDSWLDMAEAQVTVLGKGSKSRTVPVGRAALTALQAWLTMREAWLAAHPAADPAPLFLSGRGRRLSHRSVQMRLKQLALKQGIPANVHPHVLRHSFASHVLQSSGDLRAVQELLGHASIATTQVYTALDFQRLAQVYDAAHPRARRADAAAPVSGAGTAEPVGEPDDESPAQD